MSKNKKPRKAYRPRMSSNTSGLDVLDRRTPMDKGQTTSLGIAYYVAFDEMLHGRGTEEHWSTVVCALNIALVIAETGPGLISIGTIKSALDGAVRARDRARKVGKWGFDGDAVIDIRIALDVHHAQMATVTKATVLKAIAEMHRRIDAGTVFEEVA